MPVAYIDIPTGVNDGAKKKIFAEMYEAIHEAWPIPDTRVLIREWANEAVSQDGRIEKRADAPDLHARRPTGPRTRRQAETGSANQQHDRPGFRSGSRGDSPAKRNEDLQQLGSHVLLGASA